MPAVQAFAIYSSIAVFADYVLQITAFVSLLSLDAKRSQDMKMDCMPCLNVPTHPPKRKKHKAESGLQLLFRKYYAPFLLHPLVKFIVIVFFIGTFCFFLDQTSDISVGLDQRVVLPSDSFRSYCDESYRTFKQELHFMLSYKLGLSL